MIRTLVPAVVIGLGVSGLAAAQGPPEGQVAQELPEGQAAQEPVELEVPIVIDNLHIRIDRTDSGQRPGRRQRPAPPPEACGPKGDLSADLSNNVAADSRCFEVRMYTAHPQADDGSGGIDELYQRLREGEVAMLEKHGAEVVAVWQRLDNPNTVVWMLAYRDLAHRDEVWAAFREDPGLGSLLAKYPAPLEGVEVFWMSASDFSALK